MSELAQLIEILHNPLLQQALVLLAALFAGLLLMTLAARIDVTRGNTPGRALAAYRTDTVDTPLENLGAAVLRRLPALRNLLRTAVEHTGPGTPARRGRPGTAHGPAFAFYSHRRDAGHLADVETVALVHSKDQGGVGS